MLASPDPYSLLALGMLGVSATVAMTIVARLSLQDRIASLEQQLAICRLREIGRLAEPTEDDEVGVYHDEILPEQEKRNGPLIAKLREAALALGEQYPDGITSDHIHAVCPIPAGVDPRIMGSAFQKGLWIKDGWVISNRKENHGRPVRKWRLRKVRAQAA